MPRLLTAKELAYELHVSADVVRKMAKAGDIPQVHVGDVKALHFDLEDVIVALKAPKRKYAPRIIPKSGRDERILRAIEIITPRA